MKQLCSTRFWRSVLAFVLALMLPFNAVAGTFTLPAAIKVVEEKAFENNTSVDKIVLPDGATTIKSQAFKGATALERAVIPASVNSIADDAFEGVEGLVIETPRNSYAWNWAVGQNIAVEDPASPFVPAVYDQLNNLLYLNASYGPFLIGYVAFELALADGVTVEWKLEKADGDDIAQLRVEEFNGNQLEVDVYADSILAEGTAEWTLSAVTSEGESWSETIELTVEALPEDLPTEIIMDEPFTAVVGQPFTFMPSERLSHNGTIPDGVNWHFGFDVGGDIENNETVSYPLVGEEVGFRFTPDSPAEYEFEVQLTIANYTISAPATLIIAEPESQNLTFNQQTSALYLEGRPAAQIGWVSYDGLKSDPTIDTGKLVSCELEKISGDDGVDLILDGTYYNEVVAENITAAGTSVWRVSAVLSDGSKWSWDFTVTVSSKPETYPTALEYPNQTIKLGDTFEFSWDDVSFAGELPEDGNVINRGIMLFDSNDQFVSFNRTDNGFTFVPSQAGEYTLTLTNMIGNLIVQGTVVITVQEPQPEVTFGGRLADTVYATGSADGYLLGNLTPQVETAEGDAFEWSVELVESSNETPAAVIDILRSFGPTGPAMIGLMSLSGEAGTVTYDIKVKHGANEYVYTYTLNVVEAPATMPTAITVPATSYEIAVDEVLTLDMLDTRFVDGQVPEGVSANYSFERDSEITGLTFQNSGTAVNITGVTPGTYTVDACAYILNYRYVQPITIEVKNPQPEIEFSANLLDTVYSTGAADGFWLGTVIPEIELAEGETIEWSMDIYESSSETPAAEIGFNGTYENGRVAVLGLNSLSGETGSVTYALYATHGEYVYTYYYTLNVVAAPDTLPTAIQVPATSYELAPESSITLKTTDIDFADGQVPDDAGVRFEYAWNTEDVTGLTIDDAGSSIEITGVTAGTYTVNAYAAIRNYEYTQAITITVKEPQPEVTFSVRLADTVYATGSADGYLLGNLQPQVEVAEGDKFEWSIALKESSNEKPAAVVDFLRFFGETGPAVIGLMSLSGETGTVTYAITVKHGENEYVYLYTLNVVEAPDTLPTGITVPATFYQIEEGAVLTLSMLDTRFVGGQVPEGVNSAFSFKWDSEETGLTFQNSGTSLNITGVTPGTYTVNACANILNREYAQPITIIVGEAECDHVSFEQQTATLYLEGTIPFGLIGWVSYDGLLSDPTIGTGKIVSCELEKISGDAGVDLVLDGTYYNEVIAENITAAGTSVWRVSALLSDGSSWSEDITVTVTNMSEDYPTEIVYSAPAVTVGETFEFSWDEVSFVEKLPADGNTVNRGLMLRDSDGQAVSFTKTENGFTFVPEAAGEYQLTLTYRIANTITQLNTVITVEPLQLVTFMTNLIDTVYSDGDADHFWLGNAVLPVELAEGEQLEWSIELSESSNENPAAVVELTDFFDNTRVAQFSLTGLSGETGTVVYTVTVKQGELEYAFDYFLSVEEAPATLPTAISVPETYYEIDVDGTLELKASDIHFVDGQLPEDAGTRNEYWWDASVESGMSFEDTDDGIVITGIEDGVYEIEAAKVIYNYVYTQPITIVVGDPLVFYLNFPTLYLGGNLSAQGIAGFNYFGELAEGEQIVTTVEKVSGDEGVELIVDDEAATFGNNIIATNITATGQSVWLATATLPDGTQVSEEFTVTVAEMPENYPTEIIDPQFRGKVGEVFEFDWDDIQFNGVVPEDGNQPISSIGLRDVWGHETLEYTDNGFTFIPDHAGEWELRITIYTANHKLELYPTIKVEGSDEMEIFHYFQTLYVEGNMDEMDIAEMTVDTLLEEGESIEFDVEYVSGDKGVAMFIGGPTPDGLAAWVVAHNITSVGQSTWLVSATLPDGTVKSEEITVTVANMPEDYPTALIVEDPLYAAVGERFEFKPSERVALNGTLPDDGNIPIAGFPYIDWDLRNHPSLEWIEDGENGAIAFTVDENTRYGYTVGYTLSNHRVEHSGVIVVGDGISDAHLATRQSANVVFTGIREEVPHAINVWVEGYELFEGEEFEWTLEPVEGEELANVFINDYFDDNREVGIGVERVGEQTGTIKYRVSVTTESGLNLSHEFTIEVIDMPDGMPTGITIPVSEYEVDLGDTLDLKNSDIVFVGGEIPEGVEYVREYWPSDGLREEQEIEWTDDGISIKFVQEGRYQFAAVVRIGNYALTTLIQIVVGDGISENVEVEAYHKIDKVYIGLEDYYGGIGWLSVHNYQLLGDETFEWDIQQIEGEHLIDLELWVTNDEGSDATIALTGIGDKTGTVKYLVTLATSGGLEYSMELVIDVEELPEGLPTDITVPVTEYTFDIGDTHEFRLDEITLGEGDIPDGVEVIKEIWNLDGIPGCEWIDETDNLQPDGYRITFDRNGRYQFYYAAMIGTYKLVVPATIVVGDGISDDARMGYHQSMKVAYVGIPDDVYAFSGWVEEYQLLEGEQFHWELSVLEGEGLAEAYISAETDGESYEVPVIIRNVGEQTGTFVLRLSVTSDGVELSQDFTIDILELPANLPTEITVPYSEYQIKEGDTLEFRYRDITIGEGEIPEGVEPVFEYWEFDHYEDVEWFEDGLRVTFHEWGYYRGQAAVKIGNHTLTTPIAVKVGEGVGFMLSRPTTTHYINEKDFSWTGDLRLEGFRPLEDEHFEWVLERIDENGGNPAEVYLENEYPDGMGIGVYLRNFSGETGSMTYRFTAYSNRGGSWSVEHTINVEQMPDNFPTGISMPDGGFVNLPVGDILYAGYNMIEFVGGEVPEGADVYLEFWPDTVEEYGDPFLWNDNGFSSVLNKEGRYFFHAAAYVNGVEMITPVHIIVGDGVSDDLSFNTWQPMYTAFTNCDPAFALTAWVENYQLLPGEDYHWELEQLEGQEIAGAFIAGFMENNSRVDIYLDHTGEQTGTVTFRLSVTSEGGLAYSHDFSIEIVELPEGMPTEIILPKYEYEINEGDTLEFLYSDISFGEGVVPEGIEPVFEYWHLDQVEDHEWTDNGLKVTYHDRGFYHGQASARYGNYMLTADIYIKVGDAVGITFDHVTTNHYINDGSNWVGEIMLEDFYHLEDEHIEWDMERIDENEATLAEVYFDEEAENGFIISVYLKNFTGETGSMTYRFIARSSHGGEWSIEHTINVLPLPDNFPTGITMPNDGVLYLEPGSTVVCERSMVEFVGGEVPEDAEVYIDIWPGTVEDYGEPFDWNENGFTSVLNREGRYYFHVAAYVNGVKFVKPVHITIGDGNVEEAELALYRMAPKQYIPDYDYGNGLAEMYLENYDVLPDEEIEWSLELLEGDPYLADMYLDVGGDDKGATARLNNFNGETGSMTWRVNVNSSAGYSWSTDVSFEVLEMPEDLVRDINMSYGEDIELNTVYLNPGDTLVANYDMIMFGEGSIPEDASVWLMFWTDSVEECGDPFVWTDHGFTSVLHEEGRYSFRAIAYVNGYELQKQIKVIVGDGVSDDVALNFFRTAQVQYPNPEDANWLTSVELRNYFMFEGEQLHWNAELLEGDESLASLQIEPWDEAGADIRLNNFSGETGSMKWLISVTNENGDSWSEEISFEVATTPDYLPSGITMPNDGVVHLNPGDTLVASYDMIEFVDGAPSETDIVYLEFWSDSVEQFADSFEWNDNGFSAVLNEDGRYSFRAIAFINGIVLQKEVVVIVGSGVSTTAWLNVNQAFDTAYAGIDNNCYLMGAEVQDYILLDGENYSWQLERLTDEEAPIHAYIDNYFDDNRGANVHVSDANSTGTAQYRLRVTTNMGLELTHDFTIDVQDLPENMPTELALPRDHFLNVGDTFYFDSSDVSFANGVVPEEGDVRTEFHDVHQLLGTEEDQSEGFKVELTEKGLYRFKVVKRIGNYELNTPVTLYVGGIEDEMITSWNSNDRIFNNFGNGDVLVAELDTLFMTAQDNYLLWEENLSWSLEILNDNGELPAELYLDEGYQGRTWMELRARNATGGTGLIRYRVTATSESGVEFYYDNQVEVINTPDNLPTTLAGVEDVYFIEVGERFEFTHDQIGVADGEIPEGHRTGTMISVNSWLEGFEWTDNGFAVTYPKNGRFDFHVEFSIESHVLSKDVVVVVGTGEQPDAYMSMDQRLFAAFANLDITDGVLTAELNDYLVYNGEEINWTLENVTGNEPAANVYVYTYPHNTVRAFVEVDSFSDATGYTEYRLVVSNKDGEIASGTFGLNVIEKPDNLPTTLTVPESYHFELGETFVFGLNDIQFADGEVPEGVEIFTGFWNEGNLPGLYWNDEGTFSVTFEENGRYVFNVHKSIGNYILTQEVTVFAGTGVPDDAYILAQQDVHSMRAYMGAQVNLGCFDVQLYELLEGESYSWTLEKISDENVSPVTLYIDGTYDNGRGVNVWAGNVTGETGIVTYRLTVTTEQGLNLSHDVTVEVTEGRDDLPTGISVPRDHMTVYANNVIVLRRSDIEFVDGVVLDDDMVWSDYWNLECLGDQVYGWDMDNDTLTIHFTEVGTYEFTAVKYIGGVEFYQDIIIEVVERGEGDPFVNWTQDVRTIYTGLDEYSTWIGWGVLENYEVTEENNVNWRFDRISEDGDRPVDLYIEVYDDGLHADIRYTNARRPGSVTYRLIAETSDGFMDSTEFTVVVEELPENLPTELNMQTVYELEVGETFEFDASQITFANGEVPENASVRHHTIRMDELYAMEGFEWTENGFKVPMNTAGRYIFLYGKQIGNYTLSQEVVVLVGDAYPDASLEMDIPVNVLFNDTEIENAWLVELVGYELAANEEIYWSIERIDGNESNPVVVDFGPHWGNGRGLRAHSFSGETGEVTMRVTASTNAGFSVSEEFTITVIETPDNLPTEITAMQDRISVSVGDNFAFSDAGVMLGSGYVPAEVTPHWELVVDEELTELAGFSWVGEDSFEVSPFEENGRYKVTAYVYLGGYLYSKDIFIYVGTGYSDNTSVSWLQEVSTIYKDVENPETWIGWGLLENFNAFDEGSVGWQLERIDENEGNPVELYLEWADRVHVNVYYTNVQHTGSVTYRLTLTTDVGYTEYRDFTVTVEERPENLPTELDLQTVYYLNPGETFALDVAEIDFADGTVPEGASTRYHVRNMDSLFGQESFTWTSGTAFEVSFNEEGRHVFTVGKQIGNYSVDCDIILLVGNGMPSNAWVEYWGTERTLFAGVEHAGWALDAEVRDYYRLEDEGFHWELKHISGPEMDIQRNHDAGNTWLGVWYDIAYTGDETGDAVYRLVLNTDSGFYADQDFVFHIVDMHDDLPSDIVVPAEEIYLEVGQTYTARYDEMRLTDDGYLPEGAEVRHDFHVDDTLTGYHRYQWTEDGFEVTFDEEGRYHYYAVIKVNGLEYRKEIRLIVGNGIPDDVQMGVYCAFDGLHYISDNQHWIADLWLENYTRFDNEEIRWHVWPTDDEAKANAYIEPVWNDGLNAAIRMDGFTGETGTASFTVSVGTDGGYYEEQEISIEIREKPENFPEYINVHEEDIYLNVGETYQARIDGFYWFNEGSVMPEGASYGAEFWPEDLEGYHTFEWVDGGFDITFEENGRYHFYVNAAINGIDFTKEIRIHVGEGVDDNAHLNFEQVFVQHFINDQTQWIGDAHLENYQRFDNEEIHWSIEYLDEGEPLANVFIDPVWDGGLSVGVRVNDFRDSGEMNLRLNVSTDGNYSWSQDFRLVLLGMPENLPSGIEVEQEDIYLGIGETYEAHLDGFAWFTDDGEILYDVAEFFHEFHVDEEISDYHTFEWLEDGFRVTFEEDGRYRFFVVVSVNGVEYAKEIRLHVGGGVRSDMELDFMQNTHTAYATTEDNNAWIGCVEVRNYQVFENEDVHWWVERIDDNEGAPLNAYVDNLWEERDGANIHVDNFTGETGTMDFRIWFESEYGYVASTDFTIDVVEMPENLPTTLHVPADYLEFEIGDEFVLHDYDLTVSEEEGVVPEDASLHYEYWDPHGVFYNQEVWWNEDENGGFTVRFHNEGRYELTVALLINTYKLTRTIQIVVGDGMDDNVHMNFGLMVDRVYTGTSGACRIGNAYIENFNVFENEDIVWTIGPKNAEEPAVADLFISSNWERKLGANFAVDNTSLTSVGETAYVIKAVLPTGLELEEEFVLYVEELPEGLPTELFVAEEEVHLNLGDTFVMMNRDVQLGNGFVPENAAHHMELWPDENLERFDVENFYDEEADDHGIRVTINEPGEYTVTTAYWIGNYMLFKDVKIYVTEPWKMALVVGTMSQNSEEYAAAMKVAQTYGDEHVIVKTYPDNFMDATDTTTAIIAELAERDAVKAIIVAQSVPGTLNGFQAVNEMRDDVLLISGMPMESFDDMSAQADIMMYSDEVAQADLIMETLSGWGVDKLVHLSFERHMAGGSVKDRYDRLVALGQELGIEVISADITDPVNDFNAACADAASSVHELAEQYADQKIAFFSTNCGVQSALQQAVLEHGNAYYPQPCCPSPFHGFPATLGLDLPLDGSTTEILRAIANALAEYDAAGRFSTWASPVNMGIIEVAAKYAAGYAEGQLGTNDSDALRQMFNAKFGNPTISDTDYENGYAILLDPVDFTQYAGVYASKVAILTGTPEQSEEEYAAAQKLLNAYGEDRVIVETYPDDFYTEEGYETVVSQITGFAGDPNVSAIIVMQSVPGTLEGFQKVRQMRDDMLLISGLPEEDRGEMSAAADVMLYINEAQQAAPIMDIAEKMGADMFVHYSFDRHLEMEAVAARRDLLAEIAAEKGIEFVEIEMPDPTVAGLETAKNFIAGHVPSMLQVNEGKKIAFFSTNCGVQGALQAAVLEEGNALYPQPCCPSPFHGFAESLGIELDVYGSYKQALRTIAGVLSGRNALDRFSTWEVPANMAIMEVAGKYAVAYANGELSSKHDEDALRRMIETKLNGSSVIKDEFYNGYTIVQQPVEFVSYEGVAEAKIAIVTGSESMGEEEITAARRAADHYGDRVILETYPDNCYENPGQVSDQIEALAQDPNVNAIIVMQSVPGTLEGFRRVRDMRDDVLLISGLPQESLEDVSGAADMMLFADEPRQAGPIMDKCEEWGIEVFVHMSFDRHMRLSSVSERYGLIAERAEELGIEVINADIIDPITNFEASVNSVTNTVNDIMARYEGRKVAFFTTACGVQGALQSAVLENEYAYYPQPCCPSPYHGFPQALGLELDLYDSKAAMREVANALYERGAANRFSTWASPVNMSIIDVAAEYAISYVDGKINSTNDGDALVDMYVRMFPDVVVDGSNFHNGYLISFSPVNFMDYVSTDDVMQVWVAGSVVDFTAEQFENFKQENEEYADARINIRSVGEGDASALMIQDAYYGADVFAFAQDQLSILYNNGALTYLTEENAQIVSESNDAGSVAAASMYEGLCAYPMTSDNGYFLYYDKSVVENPTDLNAILTACEEAGKTFHMEMKSGWYQPAFFFGAGCEITYEVDGGTGEFTNHRVDVANENGLKAFKSMIKVVESSAFRNDTSPEALEDMGAVVSGTWLASAVKDVLGDNYAAVKLPEVDGYQMSSFGGFKLLGVKPQDSEAKQTMCDAFAMYLTSEAVQKARFDAVEWGPSNLNAQQYEAVKNNVALCALAEQMQYAVPQGQYPAEYWEVSEAFGERLLNGEFSDMTEEELFQVLLQLEEDMTSFIVIIA